jgi:hypothetical protein
VNSDNRVLTSIRWQQPRRVWKGVELHHEVVPLISSASAEEDQAERASAILQDYLPLNENNINCYDDLNMLFLMKAIIIYDAMVMMMMMIISMIKMVMMLMMMLLSLK